jgi:hypothetical protein
MAADITSASKAPRKSASREAEMISLRLRGVSVADEDVEALVFNRIQEKF